MALISLLFWPETVASSWNFDLQLHSAEPSSAARGLSVSAGVEGSIQHHLAELHIDTITTNTRPPCWASHEVKQPHQISVPPVLHQL